MPSRSWNPGALVSLSPIKDICQVLGFAEAESRLVEKAVTNMAMNRSFSNMERIVRCRGGGSGPGAWCLRSTCWRAEAGLSRDIGVDADHPAVVPTISKSLRTLVSDAAEPREDAEGETWHWEQGGGEHGMIRAAARRADGDVRRWRRGAGLLWTTDHRVTMTPTSDGLTTAPRGHAEKRCHPPCLVECRSSE